MPKIRIVNGIPIKQGNTPIIEVVIEVDGFTCPDCGRVYKTERGRDNHLASAH